LELHLEDWPDAVIGYIDIFSGAFIFAEIHTLTPVVPEPTTSLLVIGAIAPLFALRRRCAKD
jgi:hypothetical protein